MAGTFSQIHIHVIFAVQNRNSLINPDWEERLYQYITGIVKNKGQKILAINGASDHIHFFIGMKPACCLSDLVREVKKSSSMFIKENKLCNYKFSWQEGYSVFSHSHSHIDKVVKYTMNQKEHHKKLKFRDEYIHYSKGL